MALILTAEEVRQCLPMAEAIDAVEAICVAEAQGQAIGAGRINLLLPNGWMRLMPGAYMSEGVMGYKEFHLTRVSDSAGPGAEVRYAYHLFDYATGELIAMMDADYLTFIRTAAASGVAIAKLSRENATDVGVIGSGAEARSHLEAALSVRSVRRAAVYSRDADRRERFARDMSQHFGIDVRPVERPADALAGADIVLVATNTAGTGPALLGEWLRTSACRGAHINSIGSTSLTQREIDPEVWSLADRIVLDTRTLLHHSGDAKAAQEAGTIDMSRIAELSEVVTGKVPGRTHADTVTLYKSVGTGLQDVAVAHRAYCIARKRGIGREFEGYQSVKQVEPN